MRSYKYKARTNQGELVIGTEIASDTSVLSTVLKQRGLHPVSIDIQSFVDKILSADFTATARVKTSDIAVMTHQLGLLVRSGMKVTNALDTLSNQTDNSKLCDVIAQVKYDVENSSSISQAMAKHRKIFSNVYISIVAASEKSGRLAETLLKLAEDLKSEAKIKSKIKSALAYPIFLLILSFGVIAVLATFVIPRFIQLFVSANQKLPLPTKILMGTIDFIKNGWPVILIAIIAVFAGAFLFLNNKKTRIVFDSVLLKLPLLGGILKDSLSARFSSVMASLTGSGVDMITSVETSKKTVNNLAFAKQIDSTSQMIIKGSSLSKSLKESTDMELMLTNMISVGEESGQLPQMLNQAAEIYNSKVQDSLTAITTLLGPAIMVVLGGIVGFVVLAILLPVFEASTIIK